MEFGGDDDEARLTEGDVEVSNSDSEQRAVVSGIKRKKPTNAKERRNRVVRGKACDLLSKNNAKTIRNS